MRHVMVFALIAGAFCASADDLPRGAKEIFFDPAGTGGGALSVATEDGCVEGFAPVHSSAGMRCPERQIVSNPGVDGSLGLSYWIELVERGNEAGARVTDSTVFRSGDRIRLHFRSNREGSISLVQTGTSGHPEMLFPDAAAGFDDSHLPAGKDRILPGPDAWFRFDDQAGTEQVIVVFAAYEDELESILYKEPRRRVVNPDLLTLARASSEAFTSASLRYASGSRDLVIEREVETHTEIGTYAVKKSGKPIVLEILLVHR